MIDLGLGRISRLLQASSSSVPGSPAWRALHVAGTNGKGSVCAYLSAMLHARGVPCGRFTSPHLVDRWDCIVVDERPVAESVFRAAEQAVLRRDEAQRIGATEFELLTATAFEVFGGLGAGARSGRPTQTARSAAAQPAAVIECGLGGRLDATTAMLAPRAVTVITAIGLDHQALLGTTLPAIAAHKAGIMRAGVPCVVDVANRADVGVRAVLEEHARAVGAPLVYPDPDALLRSSLGGLAGKKDEDTQGLERLRQLEPHQRANLACAYAAFQIAVGEVGTGGDYSIAEYGKSETPAGSDEADRPLQTADLTFLASIVQHVRWPGRLQTLDVGPMLSLLPGKHSEPQQQQHGSAGMPSLPALLDGAHNAQSADVLGAYVDKHVRASSADRAAEPTGITWILAASHGKDLADILRSLLRPGDRVAAVAFGPVDGMPWVRPAAPQTILAQASALGVAPDDQFDASTTAAAATTMATAGDADHAEEAARDAATVGLLAALRWAATTDKIVMGSGRGPLVIAGSLYLVSDTLRLLRRAGGETGLP